MSGPVVIVVKAGGNPYRKADWVAAFTDRLSRHGTRLPILPVEEMPDWTDQHKSHEPEKTELELKVDQVFDRWAKDPRWSKHIAEIRKCYELLLGIDGIAIYPRMRGEGQGKAYLRVEASLPGKLSTIGYINSGNFLFMREAAAVAREVGIPGMYQSGSGWRIRWDAEDAVRHIYDVCCTVFPE